MAGGGGTTREEGRNVAGMGGGRELMTMGRGRLLERLTRKSGGGGGEGGEGWGVDVQLYMGVCLAAGQIIAVSCLSVAEPLRHSGWL